MKTKLFQLLLLFIVLSGCEKEDEYILIDVYTPEYQSFADFRASTVAIEAPTTIDNSGKIYVYNQYLFVNDLEKGIHIINNENPTNPVKIGFLKVKGSTEIEIKNNFLYTNSFMDLVVFDLSDILNIKYKGRAKDVFLNTISHNENGIITGYTITKKWVKQEEYYSIDILNATSDTFESTGQGGSLARFKIVDDYLYTVDNSSIDVFTLRTLSDPEKLQRVHVGFGIETIFNRENLLFLGSTRGMYIYNIDNPALPEHVSTFEHVTSCDPVVVDDSYAYVTLRGGNGCGAINSSLDVIDITDMANPTLKKQYVMDNPYGLGTKNNLLFICDGTSGLKVYDKTDVENLQLLNSFENVNAFDVIPTSNQLIMIGENTIYQYNYSGNGIDLLSEFSLN